MCDADEGWYKDANGWWCDQGGVWFEDANEGWWSEYADGGWFEGTKEGTAKVTTRTSDCRYFIRSLLTSRVC